MDGAGVRVKRVFSYHQIPAFDPFLLLDHFGSDNPDEYLAGFPDHPHRGIETITCMIHGELEHRGSPGNRWTLCAGDVQWMTAGSWINLPAKQKMCAPKYENISSKSVPGIMSPEGCVIELISGTLFDRKGPAEGTAVASLSFEAVLPENGSIAIPIEEGHTIFVYTASGSVGFSEDPEKMVKQGSVALMSRTGSLFMKTEHHGCRLMIGAAAPISEPIAWRGSIVMNTEAELDAAFREYKEGFFLKHT